MAEKKKTIDLIPAEPKTPLSKISKNIEFSLGITIMY